MRDPLPANIEGQKIVSHEVQHSVNWGYAALGVAALYIGWQLFGGESDDAAGDYGEPKNEDSAGQSIW